MDNRGGAGGVVGAAVVAQASADGYTLLLGSSGALTISPNLGKIPYDPVTDFAPVGLVATSQFILVVHPSVAATSVKQLIELARGKPGTLRYGSAGNGNVGHLAGELFASMAKIEMVHVPYKGAGPMTTDLLGGQVELAFPGLSSLVPHVKAGKLRALGVTGSRRSEVLPDLPTLSEAGLPGYEAITFWGLLAPARVQRGIIDRLGSSVSAALKTADELEDYTYRVAGCVGEFWTKLCRAHLFPRAELDEARLVADGIRFGRGLQLVNILRDLPADLKNGRCYLPADRLAAAGLTPETLLSADNAGKFLPLYHAYLDEAEAHLAAGWRYTNTLPFSQCRVRLACAWPVLLGARTIQKLRGADPAALQLRVKVSRQEVHGVLLRSLASYPLPCLWRRQFPSAGKLLHQA